MTVKKFSALLLIPLLSLLVVSGVQAADDKERRKPPTKITQKLSPAVFEQLELAQKALDAGEHVKAREALDKLLEESDDFNDYEKAQIYNFYAAVHYELGDTEATIEDYKEILRLKEIPEQLRDNALFRLAQLYFVQEDYDTSIRVLDAWMAKQESVIPDAYMLKAQAWYQLEDFPQAKTSALDALREARRREQAPKESWLALLRAVYYELEDYPAATKLLEVLVQQYPKAAYYKQLSGMYGLLGQQKKQLSVMHAAYVAGMLETESEILNLARLYMVEDAPAPAVTLLRDAMAAEQVDPEEPDNLQLLAQALALAQEHEAQIPILKKLAEASGESRHYLYLGQAQIALSQWSEAAESLRRALNAKGVEDHGKIEIQLGMALFNSDQLKQARRVFVDASDDERVGEQAANWVKYVDSEMLRKQALLSP